MASSYAWTASSWLGHQPISTAPRIPPTGSSTSFASTPLTSSTTTIAATSRQTGARRRTRLPGISLLRSDLGARPECWPRAGRSARRPPRLPRGSSHVRASPNAAPLNRVTPAPEPRPAPGRPTAPTAPRVAIGAVVVANSKGVTSEQVDVLKAEWPDSLDVLRPNVKPHLLEEGDANA